MIIIINGSVGVGKSTVAWALQEKFKKSVMLDGDYIGAVHPFEIYDENRTEYLYQTIEHLIKFHQSNGYQDFVINYVFETPTQLSHLTERLKTLGCQVKSFLLICADHVQRERIIKRSTDQKDWELQRFLELNKILRKAQENGFIGKEIDTTELSIQEVVDQIWKYILAE